MLLAFLLRRQRYKVSRQIANGLPQGLFSYILFSFIQETVHVSRFAFDDTMGDHGFDHDLQLLNA